MKPGDAGQGRPVLVTGGTGYIGSHLVLELLGQGYAPIILDTGGAAVDTRARYVQGSIEDGPLVRSLLREHRIQSLMHFAGSISVADSLRDPLAYYRNNVARTVSLVESALAEGVRQVVFASTAAVYGTGASAAVSEADPARPASPYARSKLMGEQILADASAAHPLDVAVIRCFNVVGADPEGRSLRPSGGPMHLLRMAIEAAEGRRPPLVAPIADTLKGDGSSVRDYIHVSDVAAASVLALQALIATPGVCHTFNCGAGRGHSVLQVVAEVGRCLGKPVPFVARPAQPGEVDVLVADIGRIVETLGWRPRFDALPRMVDDTVRSEAA